MATEGKNLSEYNREEIPNGADFRVGIVVSEWNYDITGNLLKGAKQAFLDNGVLEDNIIIKHVPGTFELPLGCQMLLEADEEIDGVVAIGSVIQGETKHFDFVCQATSDGIKDLNEFEIAQFADQASYIRVFTPSSEYVKTYSNEFNQSIYWRPERIWSNKKGILKVMTHFSDHVRFRVNRKTNFLDGVASYNPFATSIRDSNLISTNTNIRNTLYFNRTNTFHVPTFFRSNYYNIS
jgi:6,7-dimethyl-8-ribityllumazine synthase